MKSVDPKYLDILETLIDELETPALSPQTAASVYASIHALIEGAQCELRDNPGIPAPHNLKPEGELKNVLFHCRQAAFLKTGDERAQALKLARECIGKIRAQLS